MKKEKWESRFDKKFTYNKEGYTWGFGIDTEKEQVIKIKSFITQGLAKERERIITEIDRKVVDQMIKYANTPLKERKNAYDELYEVRKILDKEKKC